MTHPRIAIVHDYLTQRGGAERVVLAMHRTFPDAPIHTSLFEPATTFPELSDADVRVSALNKAGVIRRHHRLALPVLAHVFDHMHVEADVALCSSSAWAHGANVHGRKVVYCHTPPRWLHQARSYRAYRGGAAATVSKLLRSSNLSWDRKAARSADLYLANSTHVQELIRTTYDRDAQIVHPPCTIHAGDTQRSSDGIEPGFYLCVSRLLAYKNVDVVLETFAARPAARLVVVGEGPEARRLHSRATPNVTFLAGIDDDELRWLYANATALISAAFEDFGLTPLEAAAFGKPTVALRYGGHLDTVADGVTGVFFDELTPGCVGDALDRLERLDLDPSSITAHVRAFDEATFGDRLQEIVTRAAS